MIDICMLSTPRTDKSIGTHGKPCRAPAGLRGRHCCNHQIGEGLLVYNPINHLPGPPPSLAVAKRTGNLTYNIKLQTAVLAHPADFPLNDLWGDISRYIISIVNIFALYQDTTNTRIPAALQGPWTGESEEPLPSAAAQKCTFGLHKFGKINMQQRKRKVCFSSLGKDKIVFLAFRTRVGKSGWCIQH